MSGYVSAPPTIGYGHNDFAVMSRPAMVGPTNGAAVAATIGVQDLAAARVAANIDTQTPLMGFVMGVVILAALRVIWEYAEEG